MKRSLPRRSSRISRRTCASALFHRYLVGCIKSCRAHKVVLGFKKTVDLLRTSLMLQINFHSAIFHFHEVKYHSSA